MAMSDPYGSPEIAEQGGVSRPERSACIVGMILPSAAPTSTSERVSQPETETNPSGNSEMVLSERSRLLPTSRNLHPRECLVKICDAKTVVVVVLLMVVTLAVGIGVSIGAAEGILSRIQNTNTSIQVLSGPAILLYTINNSFDYDKVEVVNTNDLSTPTKVMLANEEKVETKSDHGTMALGNRSLLNMYGLPDSKIELNFTNLSGLPSDTIGFTVSVFAQGSTVPAMEQNYTIDSDPSFRYVYSEPNTYNLFFITYANVSGTVHYDIDLITLNATFYNSTTNYPSCELFAAASSCPFNIPYSASAATHYLIALSTNSGEILALQIQKLGRRALLWFLSFPVVLTVLLCGAVLGVTFYIVRKRYLNECPDQSVQAT